MRTTFAIHALTVGAIGGLIIGMLTRTARGHTGRPLQASRGETVAYALVLLATVIRAVVPALVPAWYPRAIEISATFLGCGFCDLLGDLHPVAAAFSPGWQGRLTPQPHFCPDTDCSF